MAESEAEASSEEIAGKAIGEVAPPRNNMDRFIDGIELIAAFFVGVVAADVFISVLLRKFFSYQIPDSYDFGRFLLGILIFWGIAATSYRGGHITVDLVWANVGPRYKRMIDVFATLVLLFVVTVQTYTLFDKVVTTYLYTPLEVQALHRGGVQRVYLGDLKAGPHEIVAFFTGKGPHERDYKRGTTIRFDKATDPKYIELQIKDLQQKLQPEFDVKVWQ